MKNKLLLAMTFVFGCPIVAGAQQAPATNSPATAYPSRPLRIVAPFPPGGGLDIIARIMAQWLTDAWGQQAVVDNRPGAGGTIGAAIAARSAPDGYTFLIVSSSHTINATLYRDLLYHTLNDFEPVSLITAAPHLLVVHPSLPVTTVKELIAMAKTKPGGLAYASGGVGSSTHLAAELFKSMAAIPLLHVPYKGTAPSLIDVMSGLVPVTFGTIPTVVHHIKAGKLRALGLTGAKRSLSAPDVPTIEEAGVPGYEAATWHGVLFPVRTPAPIIAKLNGEIIRMLSDSEVRVRLAREGLDPIGTTPQQLAAHLRREIPKWAAVIKSAGLRVE